MPKFKRPAVPKTTSIMSNITDAAEKAGAKFADTVEQTCSELADAVVGTIEGMVKNAVDVATGAYNTVIDLTDKVSNMYNSADETISETSIPGSEEFDEFLEDFDEEVAYDESLEENCNLQSTMLEDATNKCDNLTPKEAKTLAENANALNEMSSNLAQSGVDKVKNTVLNG